MQSDPKDPLHPLILPLFAHCAHGHDESPDDSIIMNALALEVLTDMPTLALSPQTGQALNGLSYLYFTNACRFSFIIIANHVILT